MRNKAIRNLLYSQISFFVAIVVCFIILPDIVHANDGLSYFANHRTTVLPYSLGLFLSGLFIFRASQAIPTKTWSLNLIANGLRAMVIFLPFVILTPIAFNLFLYWVHVIFTTVVFVMEFTVSIWMAMAWFNGWRTALLLVVQSVASAVSMLSVPSILNLQTASQLTFEVAFGILLISSMAHLLHKQPAVTKK